MKKLYYVSVSSIDMSISICGRYVVSDDVSKVDAIADEIFATCTDIEYDSENDTDYFISTKTEAVKSVRELDCIMM